MFPVVISNSRTNCDAGGTYLYSVLVDACEAVEKEEKLIGIGQGGEQNSLLKLVLLNCATDGVSLWPTYRKPFDLIFQRTKNEEWSALADDFRTFSGRGLLIPVSASDFRILLSGRAHSE